MTYYDDSTVEATLRTYVQKTTNAHFIFSGSQRHLMDGMFTSPSRPFYQSVTVMNLMPLSLDKYTEFCVSKFRENGRDLDPVVVKDIYGRFDGVTSYTSVAKSQKAPLLLGQSVLEKFGTFTVDNINSKLIIKH